METLEKIVKYVVDSRYPDKTLPENPQPDNPEFSLESIKAAMSKQLSDKIIEEVLECKKRELQREMKQKIEEERKRSSYTAIKQLLWEAFISVMFIGLLVNEMTTLIGYFKSLGSEKMYVQVTIILIIIFSVIVLALYVVKFTKDIIEKFVYKSKGGDH